MAILVYNDLMSRLAMTMVSIFMFRILRIKPPECCFGGS